VCEGDIVSGNDVERDDLERGTLFLPLEEGRPIAGCGPMPARTAASHILPDVARHAGRSGRSARARARRRGGPCRDRQRSWPTKCPQSRRRLGPCDERLSGPTSASPSAAREGGRPAGGRDAGRRQSSANPGGARRGCYAAAASCSNGPSHTSTTPAGCGARTWAVTTPS
jgi:hypothetical protein